MNDFSSSPRRVEAVGAAVTPYRTAPHNPDAEKALLGAILTNNRAHEKVSEFLRAEHFSDPANCLVYDACAKLIERGQIADPVTLKNFFSQTDALSKVGGAQYLAELAGAAVTIINAGEYGRIVFDLYLKREMIALGEDIVNDAYSPDIDTLAGGLIEAAESRLSGLVEGTCAHAERSRHDVVRDVLKGIEERYKNPGRLLGYSTGLARIDGILRGLRDTDLLILAGRPSMGKSALAITIAHNVAETARKSGGEEGAPVLVFSLEMSADQIVARQISAGANVPAEALESGKYHNSGQFHAVVEAAEKLVGTPLYIDERSDITVSQMKAHARRMKRKYAIGLIVVDYLQLISPPRGRSDGRVNDVSAMTRELKIMAKELDVPVIALSQLSRAVEMRDPPIPRLADLRDSGSIEQDADVVMFVYREEYYLERKEPAQRADETASAFADHMAKWQEKMNAARGVAEILIEKNRKGRVGKARLAFHGGYTRFANLSIDDEGGT